MLKIAVLCVTFNRLELLKKLLQIYESQEDFIVQILVVDNHSTDGTDCYLHDWKAKQTYCKREFLRLPLNCGGSGGFYHGLKKLADLPDSFDYIYLSDDDAFPENGIFSRFSEKYDQLAQKIVGICTSVLSYGQYDLAHRRRIVVQGNKIREFYVPIEEYNFTFSLNSASFVGLFIRGVLLQKIEVQKDFFISYDDTEYCLSLCKIGDLICDPELRVHHDVDVTDQDISWKKYYNVRNKLLTYRFHFPAHVVLYAYAQNIYQTMLMLLGRMDANKSYRWIRCTIRLSAWIDAVLNRKGLHKKYHPGWKSF